MIPFVELPASVLELVLCTYMSIIPDHRSGQDDVSILTGSCVLTLHCGSPEPP